MWLGASKTSFTKAGRGLTWLMGCSCQSLEVPGPEAQGHRTEMETKGATWGNLRLQVFMK